MGYIGTILPYSLQCKGQSISSEIMCIRLLNLFLWSGERGVILFGHTEAKTKTLVFNIVASEWHVTAEVAVWSSYSNTAPTDNKTIWVSALEVNTYKPERKTGFVSGTAAQTRMVPLIGEIYVISRKTSGTRHFLANSD
jgi:hypothetical protein